jgi:homoserine kinase type II
MALLTPMTLTEARALGARFGLEVAAVTPIPHGSVNSNFALQLLDGDRAFMRVCEESSRGVVEQQNRLLRHLVARGVPTPAPLELADGGTIAEHRGKPVTAFPFCSGGWICQAKVDETRAFAVGRALARIHLAGEDYLDAPPTRFGPEALRTRIEALRAGRHGELDDQVAGAVDRLEREIDRLESSVARYRATTIVHGDVFRDNVLWRGDELIAVLDFESASRGHPAFDLAVTVLAWCYGDRLEEGLFAALARGYSTERPLSGEDMAAFFELGQLAAVRFAITRITDYELRPNGVVVYKDFRRFLRRLDALAELGHAGCTRLLRGG